MPRPGEGSRAIALIRRGGPDYPDALTDLRSPPAKLYALGDTTALRLAPHRLVAIVGTRDASPYGVRVATELARAFAAVGVGVVSGLARGVDSAAHQGALEVGGSTIAVLGTGVDVPYPVGNRGLHADVVDKGLVLSEFEPGMMAVRGCFPRRNRIIAALALVTIVVEAPYKSGAINTATQALELGRIVAAVPGPIDSSRSAGSNLLLRDGAQVIATVDDALSLFGETRRRGAKRGELTRLETLVFEALEPGSASAEVIGSLVGITVREVLEAAGRLEVNGLVHQSSSGELERLAGR